jgi:hypothetical protein
MKALPKILFALTGVAALFLAYPASVQAFATYQYTGNLFTNVTGAYTMSDFVTVIVTLKGNPLPPNGTFTFSPADDRVKAFTATDGVQRITKNPDAFARLLQFTTDGTGAIANWDVDVATLFPHFGEITTFNTNQSRLQQDAALSTVPSGMASNTRAPGGWSLVAFGVPDAGSTLLLLTLTLMALGLVARRFQRARPDRARLAEVAPWRSATRPASRLQKRSQVFQPRRFCTAITRSNSLRTRVSPVPIPRTQSVFHRHAR